jgi:ubiquitin fusion degradation protein 1
MMQNLLLAEGDIIKFKSTSLPKGTYVKLRPQSKDFLDISNPKAVLETTLRRYSCLTTGDSILINYNNKRFFIDIFETRPQNAVTIIEVRAAPDVKPMRGVHTARVRYLTRDVDTVTCRLIARWTLRPPWIT